MWESKLQSLFMIQIVTLDCFLSFTLIILLWDLAMWDKKSIQIIYYLVLCKQFGDI